MRGMLSTKHIIVQSYAAHPRRCWCFIHSFLVFCVPLGVLWRHLMCRQHKAIYIILESAKAGEHRYGIFIAQEYRLLKTWNFSSSFLTQRNLRWLLSRNNPYNLRKNFQRDFVDLTKITEVMRDNCKVSSNVMTRTIVMCSMEEAICNFILIQTEIREFLVNNPRESHSDITCLGSFQEIQEIQVIFRNQQCWWTIYSSPRDMTVHMAPSF